MIQALKISHHQKILILSGCLLLSVPLAFVASRAPLLASATVFGLAAYILFVIKPFWGMVAMVFLLPFERIGAIDYVGITVRPSQVIALILIIAWLTGKVLKGRLAWQKQPILWPILFFLGVNAIGLTHAENMQRSIMVFAFTVFTLIIGLLIPQIIKTEAQAKIIFLALSITTLIVSTFGISQFLGDLAGLPTAITGLRDLYTKEVLGFPRVQSTALEPLYFANFLILPISLLAASWFGKTRASGMLGLPLLTVAGVAFVLTVARGGYLGLIASLIVIFLFSWRQVIKPGKILALLATGLVIGFAALQLLSSGTDAFSTQKFSQHIQNLFSGASYEERVATFDLAKQAFREQPLVGIGPGQFGPYASINPFFEPKDGWKIVNNLTLELLAETGILGLSFIVVVFGVLLWRSIKALKSQPSPWLRSLLVGGTAALVGIFVQYQTFSILYIIHVWVAVGLLVAFQNLALAPERE